MKTLLRKVYTKIKQANRWGPDVTPCSNLITIGTKNGGWTIPSDLLSENSVAYLAGAGEDISFDVGIAERFRSNIHIFDPTPRAKAHFDRLLEGVRLGQTVLVSENGTEVYELSKENTDRLTFHEIGLWDKREDLKFFVPKDPSHVSHSVVNLQGTDEYFIAKVDRISAIMERLGHKVIDLLKIDIEGAEYKVLESVAEDRPNIKVICVEYDEAFNSLDNQFMDRIKSSVLQLMDMGYKVVDFDPNQNYTFVREDLIG